MINGNREKKNEKKSENHKKAKKSGSTIIINNNVTTYNYNLNINNYHSKTEGCLNRKRHRFNSVEGMFYAEVGRDEKEYIENFNCTFRNLDNDYEIDKELKDWFKVEDDLLVEDYSGGHKISGDFKEFMVDFNNEIKVI